MRLVLGLTALLCSLTISQQQQQQQPRPCKSPPYLTGTFFASLQGEVKTWNYEFNAALQRMRVYETEHQPNRTFTHDFLLHFREGVMFEIDGQTLTCSKRGLRADYQPIGVPHNAIYSSSYVMGTFSVPKAGMSVHSWTGLTPRLEVYSKFVTEEGCVPFHTSYFTDKYGAVSLLFMNNTMHTTTPDDLSPPRFCPDISVNSAAKPVDLFGLFSKSKARHLTRTLSKLKEVYLNNYTAL